MQTQTPDAKIGAPQICLDRHKQPSYSSVEKEERPAAYGPVLPAKTIRADNGYREQMEVYIRDRSEAEFIHGIRPECIEKRYPELSEKRKRGELIGISP